MNINPVDSPTRSDTQTLSGTKETGVSVNIVAASGVSVGTITYPDGITGARWESDLTTLHEGTNNITVLATDAALNTGSAATSIVVDTTATVSLNSLGSPTNKTTLTLSGGREFNATVSVAIQPDATIGTVTYPSWTAWRCLVSDLQEGDNIITINTIDALGNTGNTSATVTVDLTPPALTVNSLPVLHNDPVQVISGTTEAGAVVIIAAPGPVTKTVIPVDTNWSTTLILTEGYSYITVTARDSAGNQTSQNLTTTLDTIANVTISPLPYATSALQTLSGTTETGSTIQLSADTAAVINPVTVTGSTWNSTITLVEGPNIITVDVEDPLTNTAQIQTTIVLDTIVPTVTIDSAPTLVSKASQTISGTRGSDSLVTINSATVSVSGLSYPSNTSWQASIELREGSNTFTVFATDPAGNSSSANGMMELDSIAELTFNPLPTPTNDPNHTLSGTLELGSTKLEGSSALASIGPLTIDGTSWSGSASLVEGENSITVSSEDLMANANSITQMVILDTVAPHVTINPVPTQLNSNSILLTGTRDSDGIVIVTNVGQSGTTSGFAPLPGAETWEMQASLFEGDNDITVTARDAAGNSSSANISINVDTTAAVTLDPIPSPTNIEKHNLSGTKDTDVTVEISINGAAPIPAIDNSPTTWSLDQVALTEGANQINIIGTDSIDNKHTITASVLLDTTPPAQVALTAMDTLMGESVSLDWTGYPSAAEGVSSFILYVSQTDFTDIINMIPFRTLSPGISNFTVQGVENNESWYFAVVAVDSTGNLNNQVNTASAIPTTQGIDGYIADTVTGLPLWGARVTIDGSRSTTTNNEGYFHLAGLFVGNYDLHVSGAGYIAATGSDIVVQTATMTRVNFSLDKEIIPPSIPQNVSAQAGDQEVTISWNSVADTFLAGYRVYRFTSPGDTNPTLINSELITGTYYVDMDLTNNQTYYYIVRSVDQAELASGDSSMVNATPVVSSPLAATNLIAILNNDNTANLTWEQSATPGVTQYNIYQDSGNGIIDYASAIGSVPGSTTQWSSPVLPVGSTYYFGVRAEKNGLEESNTTLVASVTVPQIIYTGPKVLIAVPYSGKTISGNLLTIEGVLVQGTASQVKHVLFQYRSWGSLTWNDIAPASAYSLNPDTDAPYFIHWDVVTAVPVGDYELRAVTTAIDDSVDQNPETIVITIDHAEARTKEYRTDKSRHSVQRFVRRWLRNKIRFYSNNEGGSYTVIIPDQALESDTDLIVEIPKDEEMAPKLQGYASIGKYLRLKLTSGQKQFISGREVEITIPYTDANNDDIVDGTSIHADDLEIRWYNPGSNQWENSGIIQVSVDKIAKTVTVTTNHFSVFAVLGSDASGGIASNISSHDFGQQVVGTTSSPQLFTVSHDGGSDVTIGTISISGLHSGDFNISQDTCSNTTLTSLETCELQLTFTPTAAIVSSATLSVPSDDPSSPLQINLSGEGLADSDGDLMPDTWETSNGLNPNANDAGLDPDGDGFTNLQEYQNGTNPLVNESTIQPTKVPVFNGFWLLIGTLSGLFFCRRRRKA